MPTRIDFKLTPFKPARGLRDPHLQTAFANLRRPVSGVTFRRERLETPDGDFVDIDFADVDGLSWFKLPADAPVVLALHGLEGSARRGYMCETYRQLAYRGVRPVGLNFRSCSGEMNRTPRSYNAGATGDVALVHQWLSARFPDVPIGMIGFSLGANCLLKYLGECGRGLFGPPPAAAVAVSAPFDLAGGVRVLDSRSGRVYRRRFLGELKAKVSARRTMLSEYIDVNAALSARSLEAFDNAVTAPLFGYRSAADYYARCSSGQFLPDVAVPTLLLRALDDPFFENDIPAAAIEANPELVEGFTEHGGHIAFVEGAPWRPRFWAERQAARFLSQLLF